MVLPEKPEFSQPVQWKPIAYSAFTVFASSAGIAVVGLRSIIPYRAALFHRKKHRPPTRKGGISRTEAGLSLLQGRKLYVDARLDEIDDKIEIFRLGVDLIVAERLIELDDAALLQNLHLFDAGEAGGHRVDRA